MINSPTNNQITSQQRRSFLLPPFFLSFFLTSFSYFVCFVVVSSVDLPHNPYVGFFHGTLRLRSLNSKNMLFLPTTNPHVGLLRHAPSNQPVLKEQNNEEKIGVNNNNNNNTVFTNFVTQLKDRRKV